jgi:sugar lactone lactonase YvrE
VGNFGFDLHAASAEVRPAELVLVTPEGDARVVARELRFPNGMVVTPDGGTLVVGESYGACLTAFDIQEDGSLENRREWAKLEKAVPDGICLDAEGAIWVASPLGNEALRVREGGDVTHRIRCSRNAIACMLGGPEGRQLFVCTSTTTEPKACKAERPARIEVAEVEVPGAGWP